MNSWAIGDVDLHLDVPAGRGVRAALEAALRTAIRGGRLAAGTRLPASRTLAADLGIARNTVADAYGQLVAEGYLTARPRAGTRVAGGFAAPVAAARPRPAASTERPALSLLPGTPDVSRFPREAWLAASRRALAAAPHAALGYGDPRGQPATRQALAGYLARVRGVQADPELVVICTGFAQGLDLLARALAARGTTAVATEQPGLPWQRDTLRAHGLAVASLPIDAQGARTDLLDQLDCGAAVLTPAHQFPTGTPLHAQRRAAALRWARERDAVVIEDDYDGEFRFDRQPVGALQGLAPEHVVYAGTASKALAPGLRLGWLVVPRRLIEPVIETKRRADRLGSVLAELTLAEFVTSGALDRHVRQVRQHYRRRRERLVAELAGHAPRARVVGAAAGLQALVTLPPGSDETRVQARARRLGLDLHGVARYGGDAGPALVIGYAAPPEHAYARALAVLCQVLAEL